MRSLLECYVEASRRETLLSLVKLFDDPVKLKEVVGQNVLIDSVLWLIAREDPEYMRILTQYLDVCDLHNDIAHVAGDRRRRELIRKAKEELCEGI